MKLRKQPSNVTVIFSPQDYCLVKIENGYSLNHLISREEKGKDPDVGLEVMLLSEDEAKIFKESGFREYLL
jgi:hypothetical protein